MKLLQFQAKKLRAEVIKEYLTENGIRGAVCFSCGNTSRALREAGIDTLDISPTGDLQALRWFTPSEIKREFPDRLDATSGHLGPDLMNRIASAFLSYLGSLQESEDYVVPTGSGETIIALKIAYPTIRFHAVYNLDAATSYDSRAPLNGLVKAVAASVTK